ncbi:MAG: KAP family NTPase [Prevotella sp.]|nr:KAP family NTPase [Prevotella sp.]
MSINSKSEILGNRPCGEDLFEGNPHDKLADIISADIKKDIDKDKLHIIGIEGEWGSGKSNLIEIIKKKLEPEKKNENKKKKIKCHFFTYDAWEHQTDLPRRTLLEELTTKLVKDEKILSGDIWEKKLQDLMAKKKRTNTITVPTIGVGTIAVIISITLIPLLHYLASLFENDLVKMLISVIPILIIFAVAIIKTCITTKRQVEISNEKLSIEKIFTNFFLIYKDEIKENTTYETILENEPTSNKFKEWFSGIDTDLKKAKKFLIIVIDNMDRLPKDKVRELWAVILSLFSEKEYLNIRIIVPFDRKQLRSAFQTENIFGTIDEEDGNAISYADDFINKTFSVVYCVPPPIMSGWMLYFQNMWEKAFGGNAVPDNSVLQIYDALTLVHTPRKIISFINQFVTIKNISNQSIEDKYIALYIFGRNEIMKDPLKEILQPSYLGGLTYLYKNDVNMSKSISSLHFQLPLDKAMDIVYTREITRELDENKCNLLEALKRSSKYWMILYHSISNVVNIENATFALDASLKDDQSSAALNIWEALFRKMQEGRSKVTEYKEFHSVLMSHMQDKSDYYKYLLTLYHNNIKDDFDVENYINGVDSLQEILCDDNDENISQFHTEIEPRDYFSLIRQRRERFTKYGLVVDANKFDDYISNLSDKTIGSEKIYPYTKGIIDTPQYVNKVKILFKNKFNINVEGELLIDRIKEIETRPFKIINYFDITKLTNLARNVHKSDKSFPDILAIAIAIWDIQGAANFRVPLQLYFNSNDTEIVKHVAEVIEYYISYGDLLLKLPKCKPGKLFVAVARDLTINRYGESRMDVKRILSNYDMVVRELGLSIELLSRINDEDAEISLNDIETFPTELFVDLQRVDNELSQHCLRLATEYLQTVPQEKWHSVLANTKSDFSFELFKIYHRGKLSFCFDAFKELMIDYAKGESNIKMPKVNVEEFIKICEDVKQSLFPVFMEIRDVFINNPNITKDKLKYMGNWLMKYGQLWENNKSLEKIFQSQYLDDDAVVEILINHSNTTKKILDVSNNSDDFRNKMHALLTTKYKTNDAFKELCALLGIE